jgi:uncharacterized protein YndB with AHSA1/START domain
MTVEIADTARREGARTMAVKELGNERTRAYTDGPYLVMERVFDAPRELVWKVLTDPDRIPHWWGPRTTSMTVVEQDLRVGGRWRWIAHSDEGDAPFTGEYLEVVPPERLVRTEIFDIPPFNADPSAAAVETMTLEDLGGKTKLTSRSRFPSVESLDGALATGMIGGALESWDRVAEQVAAG